MEGCQSSSTSAHLCKPHQTRAALSMHFRMQAVVPIGRVPLDILLPYYSLITRHRQASLCGLPHRGPT